MREVGDHLGNTATVARGSYVDPRVVDLFNDGITVAAGNRSIAPGAPVSRTLERQVLRLLKRGLAGLGGNVDSTARQYVG